MSNINRVIKGAVGFAALAKIATKFVPEGNARTFSLGMATGGLAVAVLDDVGVEVLSTIRSLYGAVISHGESQMPKDSEGKPVSVQVPPVVPNEATVKLTNENFFIEPNAATIKFTYGKYMKEGSIPQPNSPKA